MKFQELRLESRSYDNRMKFQELRLESRS